jgi:hypothetical protein
VNLELKVIQIELLSKQLLAQTSHVQEIKCNRDNNLSHSFETLQRTPKNHLRTPARHYSSILSDIDTSSGSSMSPNEPFPSFRYSLNTPSSTFSTPSVSPSSGRRSTPSIEYKPYSPSKTRPQSYIPTNPNSVLIIPLEFELLTYSTHIHGSTQFYDKPCIISFLAGSIELRTSTQYQDLRQEIRDIYNELVAIGKLPGLQIVVDQVTLLSLKSDVTEDNVHHISGVMKRREGSETLVATIKPMNSWRNAVEFERVNMMVKDELEAGDRDVEKFSRQRRSSI